MIIKSEITGKEYDVKTYSSENFGGYRIDHSSLQDILENKLGSDVSYDVEVLAATPNYCAAKCTIEDKNGRKVEGFNDVNTRYTSTRERKDFAVEHPLLAAVNAAIDTAVRAYLKLEKVYADDGLTKDDSDVVYEETVVEDIYEEMPEPVELPFMNLPEDEPEPEIPSVPEPDEGDLLEKARLEELKGINPPAGTKYASLTLEEAWETQKGWFDFVTKNKAAKYDEMKEFAQLKQKEEAGLL